MAREGWPPGLLVKDRPAVRDRARGTRRQLSRLLPRSSAPEPFRPQFSDCDASASGQLTPTQWKLLMLFGSFSPRRLAGDFPAASCARATQGFATGLTGAFEAMPVVTAGELIISRLVFTRLALISAHTKKIDANRHMMAKK